MTTELRGTTPAPAPPPASRAGRHRWRHLLGILGPGLVTGAADDDPSGIATYSQTGAQFGYAQLWTAFWMLPLVTGVQEACGRIGNVTGHVINIGADIGALGASAGLIIHIPVATKRSLRDLRTDNAVGMFFSQATTWFIIITAATVLHTAHVTSISTAADAARALEPLVRTFPHSGQIAQGLFALGIVSLGLLAIPVMAGSTSYALSEARGKRRGWTSSRGGAATSTGSSSRPC